MCIYVNICMRIFPSHSQTSLSFIVLPLSVYIFCPSFCYCCLPILITHPFTSFHPMFSKPLLFLSFNLFVSLSLPSLFFNLSLSHYSLSLSLYLFPSLSLSLNLSRSLSLSQSLNVQCLFQSSLEMVNPNSSTSTFD